MTQDKKEKLSIKSSSSLGKSRTADQRAKKKISDTLLCILDMEESPFGRQLDLVSVPFQKWMAATFKNKAEGCKVKSEEKTKPRLITQAVAVQALRRFRMATSSTGIAYPTEVAEVLKEIDTWTFDVFVLDKASEGHSLKYMMCELFNKYDLLSRFKIPLTTLIAFAEALEAGYARYLNAYHNAVHAADVTQTVHSILMRTGAMHWFTDLEILALFFSTAVHDYEHTGTTNNFHIQTRSQVALLYNDRSVLENHHVSAAYQLLQKPELNILFALTKEEWSDMRLLVVEMVLGTDMSGHFQHVKNVLRDLQLHESVEKGTVMSTIVHVADLSHPAKPWELHLRWSEGIMDEFFKQGDMEAQLGLPISPLCDRVATNVPESQIGFLDVIVKPVFTLLFEEVEELIVPFLRKVASKELCQKSTGASGVKKSQSGNDSMGEGGPCAEEKVLSSLDISAFKTTVMHYIQANRNKWKEALEAKRKEEESNKAKESNNSKESPEKESNKAKENKTKESPGKESNKAKENKTKESPGKESNKAKESKTKESPGNESNNAHNHEDKAHNKKTQKRTSSNTALSKSKKYCVVPQAPSTCDCQLCDSRAFEPMNLNFIVFNTGLPEMFLPRQDSEAMEVTESYEELADKESSWRKAAGQTVESNIQEMRAMVPKTKPLSPNESDDVIIEEFVPDDPQSQMALTSGPPAISGPECSQQPPNVGFIMTDLSKSDMEIFSLWNEEVLRRAAEQQKQDHLPAPDDAPLQVAVSAKQQMECQGYEGASEGKPPETFVLQVISFDSPSMTFSKDATLNCNPGLQALPSPTADGSVVPVNTSQQSQTDSCDAAAVSITSLNYGVFQLPQ